MRATEFLEGGPNNQLSTSRLLMLLAYPPATYVLIVNAHSLNIGEILGVYLGAFVLGYIGGRFSEKPLQKDCP